MKSKHLNESVRSFSETGWADEGRETAGAQNNPAFGDGAFANQLASNLDDSALGSYALHKPTSGFDNTAAGAYARFQNTTGANNAASGGGALGANITSSAKMQIISCRPTGPWLNRRGVN